MSRRMYMCNWFALLDTWNGRTIGHQAYSKKISLMEKNVPYKRAKKRGGNIIVLCDSMQCFFFFFSLPALLWTSFCIDGFISNVWLMMIFKSSEVWISFFLHIYILLKNSWLTMHRCTARWFYYTYTLMCPCISFSIIGYDSIWLQFRALYSKPWWLVAYLFFFFLLRNVAFYSY